MMLTAVEKELATLLQYDPPYEWRGGNLELINSRAPEVIVEGGAETGKTYAACYKTHFNCRQYPGSQHTLIRKVAANIPPTVLVTLKRIIGNFPVNYYGGDKNPEMIIYPTGSTIWLAGMDKPGKALSGERDTIQVCQAEELSIEDWETLSTRTTGRGAVMPYTQLFGDCNPGPARWIKDRAKAGSLQLIPTKLEDNPSLFTTDGKLTAQGVRSLARLDALTGNRYKRLRLGLWVSAEGAIYDEFDPMIHMIDADKCPPFIRRFRVIDFGFTNPFVCQWWGMDADGRLYRYREIYITHKLVEDLTPDIVRLSTGEGVEYTIADHDAEDRATMEKHGIKTKAAKKDVSPGIQAVKARLKVQADGKPRIYFVRGALVERDESLAEAHKPICTEDEVPEYIWQKTPDGKPDKEQPLKLNDHGCDTTRYIVAEIDIRGEPKQARSWKG
jgi:PBSX family phage terminase large subunit